MRMANCSLLNEMHFHLRTINNTNFSWIPDYELETLSDTQRIIFRGFIIVISVLSILANLATIVVNSRRKMKPFFRMMLFSLACCDLITTVFSSTAYVTQLSDKFIQIWHLGDIMCSCVPFMSTAAILINSMTLVGIAFDRYMSVMIVISNYTWEPGLIFCFAFLILVWGMATGLASPMLMSYYTKELYLIITNPENRNECIEFKLIEMCLADKALNSFYYIIIFSIVFIPAVLTFVWLNSVIAMEILNRRKINKGVHYNQQPCSQRTLAPAIIVPEAAEGGRNEAATAAASKTLADPFRPLIMNSVKTITPVNTYNLSDSHCKSNGFHESNSIDNVGTPSTFKTILDNDTEEYGAADVQVSNAINDEIAAADIKHVTVSINIFNIQQQTQSSLSPSISSTIVQQPTEILSVVDQKLRRAQLNQREPIATRTATNCQPVSFLNQSCSATKKYSYQKRREARQLRLFIVIILLMLIFLGCRLPSWIYLLMMMYGVYRQPVYWILRWAFGTLALFSCLLNPFCYTFMTETSRFLWALGINCRKIFVNSFRLILQPFAWLWHWILNSLCSRRTNEYEQGQIEINSTENLISNSTLSKNVMLAIENPTTNLIAKENGSTKHNNSVIGASCDIVRHSENDKSNRNNSSIYSNRNIVKRKSSNKSYYCDSHSDRNPAAACHTKEIYTIFQEK